MNININNFDGPLDLLLHLIKVNEMDIMDIVLTKDRQEQKLEMDLQ